MPVALLGRVQELAGEGRPAIRSLPAIMKAGAGYLPLDPSLPPSRLARVCAEARPAAILTGRSDKKTPGGDQGPRDQ